MTGEASPSQSQAERPIDRFAHILDVFPHRQRPELSWVGDGGVLVNAKIPTHLLDGYELNPLVDPSVSELGDIHLQRVRQTGSERSGEPKRLHRLYTIDRAQYKHAVEVTDPAQGRPEFVVVSFPGFTESIEGAFRQGMQQHLANQFPQARIISIGSNGIGNTGDKYGWNERSLHGLRAMALQRLALTKALAGHTPLYAMGTSMGTVVDHHFARENTFGTPRDGSVNLKGMFWLSPALVDPKNVLTDMGIKFIPQMWLDTASEIGLKTHPLEAIKIARNALKYGIGLDDCVAMGNQILELLRGTPEQTISEVLDKVPTVMVAGEKDILAQWHMQERLQASHPNTYTTKLIRGRGHSLGMKPGRACPTIAKAGGVLLQTGKPPLDPLAKAA